MCLHQLLWIDAQIWWLCAWLPVAHKHHISWIASHHDPIKCDYSLQNFLDPCSDFWLNIHCKENSGARKSKKWGSGNEQLEVGKMLFLIEHVYITNTFVFSFTNNIFCFIKNSIVWFISKCDLKYKLLILSSPWTGLSKVMLRQLYMPRHHLQILLKYSFEFHG